jgi:hypothetical protein
MSNNQKNKELKRITLLKTPIMIHIIKNVTSMKTCLILIISLFTFIELKAQDDTEQNTEQSGDDLAKKLANPNATLGVLFGQFDYVQGIQEMLQTQGKTVLFSTFSPVYLFPWVQV